MNIVAIREQGHLAGEGTVLVMSERLARAISQSVIDLMKAVDAVPSPAFGLVAELPDVDDDLEVFIMDYDSDLDELTELPPDQSLCPGMVRYKASREDIDDLSGSENWYDGLYLVVTSDDAFVAASRGTSYTLYTIGLPDR